MSSNRKSNSATSRLKQDYLRLKRDPVPYIIAEPIPSNILEWHYCVSGPEATPYEGGYYHGKLVFPREFPFKPPAIYMITPSGRFKTNTRLCLSISDFHPDTWNPAWSVSTILTGLLSFMIEKSPTLGSIETSDYEKKQLAQQSLEFNLRSKEFSELFPETVTNIKGEIAKRSANQPTITDNIQGFMRQQSSDQSPFQAVVSNLCVFFGFAIFAFTVRYVLRTLGAE